MSVLTKRSETATPAADRRPSSPRFVLYFGCAPTERADVEKRLTSARIHVIWAESSAQALAELARRDMPVLLDLSRSAAALQLARDLRIQKPATSFYAVVDRTRSELTSEAVLVGAADVFERHAVVARLARVLAAESPAESFNGPSPATAGDAEVSDDLYAYSAAMAELAPVIAKAAIAGSGALIVGEPGSGREVVAHAMHAACPESRGPFVSVDCTQMAGDDLADRLFGADTDTGLPSKGPERVRETSLLARARGGTLYLTNVAEASTRLQARLARLLRDREAFMVETGTTVPFDVRPILEGDLTIDADVEQGRIRDDLFRRVSATRVCVPPLRNRREDIPALANRFLREATRGAQMKCPSRSALALLSALPWPGNASELKKVLVAIASTTSGNRIMLEDILLHVRLDGGAAVFSGDGTLREARTRFEREYIGAMLRQHRGRVTEAAKALGIQRPNLYRKIRSLNVSRVSRRGGAA
jgi:two-component system nitrogen regulation response regulator NtrX